MVGLQATANTPLRRPQRRWRHSSTCVEPFSRVCGRQCTLLYHDRVYHVTGRGRSPAPEHVAVCVRSAWQLTPGTVRFQVCLLWTQHRMGLVQTAWQRRWQQARSLGRSVGQKWECARGGSLLWMLTPWCTARRENHRDRTRTGLIAYSTWWLGLSQGAVAAHERQTRGLPVHLLDMESIREGAMPALGSEMGPTRRARHDYNPSVAYGDGMAAYALPALSTVAVRQPMYAGLNESLLSQAASDKRVGMTAHQFMYARGGERLLTSEAQRDVIFPPGQGTRMLRVRTLDLQHRARFASAADKARLEVRARRNSIG